VTSNDATPTIPAGWYPDHDGGPRLRWWDGTQWTEHVSEPAPAAAPVAYAPYTLTPTPEPIPAGTPAGTAFIWVIVLLPIVSVLLQFTFDYSALSASATTNPLAIYTDPGYLLSLFGGLVLYAATVVLAYFDWRQLRRAGFASPFHWAFSFIGGIVYVIGRSVIVYRRAHRGLAPLWAYIGITVLSLVITFIRVGMMVSQVVQNVPNLPTNA
jgi:hypothetical protein